MKHKWHKEIKAWADGAEIEHRIGDCWRDCEKPVWGEQTEYRIKPQPKKDWVMICKRCGDEIGIVYEHKEPQYLYVHRTNEGDITFEFGEEVDVVGYKYIGKIKLEDESE